ncbi:MAG: ArsR/SmtB family transcription factor [Geminicoccaceae bacterium]
MIDRLEQSKAIANKHRVKVLQWLADPRKHFANQTAGDPLEIGVCVTLLTDKLGMAQPTVSRHLEVLRRAELLSVRKIGRWSYFARNEAAIAGYKQWLQDGI